MKLLLLLLIPFLSFAQTKGDTKVIITVTDTTGIFNKTALTLYQRGYSLSQKDESLKFLATDPKPIKYSDVKVQALINGNQVILTGLLDSNFFPQVDFEPIVFKGMNGRLYKVAFNELIEIGKSIGGTLSYSK